MLLKLKIMTFNLRRNVESDEKNAFPCRAENIVGFLAREMADVIGFQEANTAERRYLSAELAKIGYCSVGCGRSSELLDEATMVSYRRDCFEMLSMETKWLSDTPDVPGSRFGEESGQSHWPRIFTSVTLKHDEAQRPFTFVNLHTDHKGEGARLSAGKEIIDYLASRGGDVIVTGDFNAFPDTPEIKIFTENEKFPLRDLTENVGGTFHGFGELTEEHMTKIDYIFTNLESGGESTRLTGNLPDGQYLSDHYPVAAYVALTRKAAE